MYLIYVQYNYPKLDMSQKSIPYSVPKSASLILSPIPHKCPQNMSQNEFTFKYSLDHIKS